MALALAAFTLTALAQPSPATTVSSPSAKPATGGGPPMPGMMLPGSSTSSFPPFLAGIITPEEYRTYVEFHQHLNDDPAIKDLNAKITELTKELQRLRAESGAVRERLTDANSEIKTIRDKIMSVMRPRAGSGPSPMPPAPAKSN